MTLHGPDIRAEAPVGIRSVVARIAGRVAEGGAPDAADLAGTAFGALAQLFSLTEPESAAIAILAAAALDRDCAAALAGSDGAPTLDALAPLLPDLAWDSLSPASVLRAWFLIGFETAGDRHAARLALDPRILDWCLGRSGADARLAPYMLPLEPADFLPKGHADAVDGAAARLAAGLAQGGRGLCLVVGEGAAIRDAAALRLAGALGMQAVGVDLSLFDMPAPDRAALARLLARETVLERCLPVISTGEFTAGDARLLRGLDMPVLVLAEAMAHRAAVPAQAQVVTLDLPDAEARAALWRHHLGEEMHEAAAELAETFVIGADDIGQIVRDLRAVPVALPAAERALAAQAAARRRLAPPPDPLLQEITPRVGWGDLVLPAATESTLRAITAQMRRRAQVYRSWKFGARMTRGLGITALFSGPSGTGKTLAAEVMAADLGLPLLRVNLAQVVDKYVGETEKHLDHVFTVAERAGAILFFDEAEALFRQRGEGDRAQERFSAMTVAYLLQRLESCAATCILATNMRGAIDDAFLRRMRFAIHFAFPAAPERARLWRAAFPDAAPLGDVDPGLLATLPATGGTIRNAALNAAFLAAERGCPIGMEEILAALDLENAKLPQPIDLGPVRRRAQR